MDGQGSSICRERLDSLLSRKADLCRLVRIRLGTSWNSLEFKINHFCFTSVVGSCFEKKY